MQLIYHYLTIFILVIDGTARAGMKRVIKYKLYHVELFLGNVLEIVHEDYFGI